MGTMDVGELLYQYNCKVTGISEYGISFEGLVSGTIAPPAEGARFDVHFDGTSAGPRLKGRVTGTDYVRVRADGRFDLHIHAAIATDDGHRITLYADGVALPQLPGPIVKLRENVTLFTSSKDYSWVNGLQIWATGTVDLAEQVIRIEGYSA